MSHNELQFSVWSLSLCLLVVGCYLGMTRFLAGPEFIGIGLVFYLLYFLIIFVLVSRPPRLDRLSHSAPTNPLPLLQRLVWASLVAMAISLLVVAWAARGK